MSRNTTGSRLPTHKNLKFRDRIAAFERPSQQKSSPPTSPNLSATSPSPEPSLPTARSNTQGNKLTKGSVRDKVAKLEATGDTPPIPKSTGFLPHEDDVSRRKGEMLGNRVPGLNRPTALPTSVLRMVPKSHLTVKPIAKDPARHHTRGESQSLGGSYRRFTSYSTLTSPSLSAYDGEGGAELLEVDEFGGLNGLDRPQAHYSPTLTPPPSMPFPEATTIDKLLGEIGTRDRFQRRIMSDFQASYGITRALTPDPEVPVREEFSPPPEDSLSCPRPEAEPVAEPLTSEDLKETDVEPPTEPTPEPQSPSEPMSESQTPTPDAYIPPAIQEVATETSSESTSVDCVEDDIIEGSEGSADVDVPTCHSDDDSDSRVSKPNPISVPSTPVIDSANPSPPVLSQDLPPSTPTPVASTLPVVEKRTLSPEPVEEPGPSPTTAESHDIPRPEETPAQPTFMFQPPPCDPPVTESASSELQTPPGSPSPPSSSSTSTFDLSDPRIDYQNGSNLRDPDDDLFVLPLPKDDELPPRPIVKEVAVPQSMHQVSASPAPMLQPPIDFPIMTGRSDPSTSSDPNISLTSFTGDESLALDASQAEIVIAQSELIRPASPTLFVAMPSPPPSTPAFSVQTPPLSREPFPQFDQVDETRASPPRIRKKLYSNYSVLTSFKDSLSPPASRPSFSAVVHQKAKTPISVPDRVESLTPKPTKPASMLMTPKKQRSLFSELVTPASPGSELAFLMKNAAILEARLERGDSDDEGQNDPKSVEPPRSTLRSGIATVKSASTPTLVPSLMTTQGRIPPVPDLVHDDGSSNSGLSFTPQIPPFLPHIRSRKSGAQEEADRKSLAPSHKSRKSEKSLKEKDKDSMPRARKLSSRLRSLASASTNSLRSFGRPSMSSETSVSFDSPATVSIEPVTPQDTGSGESGGLGSGIGSPGSRSGSERGSPPRKRDVLGRASSFADRLMSRVGKNKLGFLDNSQDSISGDYLSPMRANTVSHRNPSYESQRGKRHDTRTSHAVSPPRVEIPLFTNENARTPQKNSNSSDYLSGLRPPSIPLTPSTPDSSSLFDSTELFDAFPSVPQNLPHGPGSPLLSGFELTINSDTGPGGLGKTATTSSNLRPRPPVSFR